MPSANSRLLLKMHDIAIIHYSLFRLMDWDGAAGIPSDSSTPGISTHNGWVRSTPNFARIEVTFDNQAIDVWFELWDGPAPESRFETDAITTETWTGTFRSSSGQVVASEIIDPREAPPIFDLGRPETEWQLRITLRTLVEEEKEWDERSWDTPITSHGLEEVLFQFWI